MLSATVNMMSPEEAAKNIIAGCDGARRIGYTEKDFIGFAVEGEIVARAYLALLEQMNDQQRGKL